MMVTQSQCIPLVLLMLLSVAAQISGQEWEIGGQFKAPEAHQAAAADHDFVYAIDSTRVAKYDRESGELIAISQDEAIHLNSGFLIGDDLYCAHSNWTRSHLSPFNKHPALSQIKLLKTKTMQLETFKDFGNKYDGYLTWVVRHDDHWWCNFARYGTKKSETFLAKFDNQWQEQGRWSYPDQVLKRLQFVFSISGGVWRENELLVTGHGDPVLFRLTLPDVGNELTYVGEYQVPFSGQGIALDPKSGGMVGIMEGPSQIVFALPPRPAQLEKNEIDENVKHVQQHATSAGRADQSAVPNSVFEYSTSSVCCEFFQPCCESGIRRGLFVRCRARVGTRRK